MRTFWTILAASTALVAATPAAAAVGISFSNDGDPFGLPAGQTLIANFDDAGAPTAVQAAGVTLTLSGSTVGVCEGCGGYSGTLPGDGTHYLTIPGGASATLESTRNLGTFSLFMGSPDTYNQVEFFGAGGYHEVLSGTDIFLGDTNQSWSWGKRVNFDFGGYNVNKIVLSSSGNSFEVDNAAGVFQSVIAREGGPGGVPEPATWTSMILGFGLMGAAARRRRQQLATVRA